MDKTKKAPIPEPKDPKKADPTFVRGTIDPPVRK